MNGRLCCACRGVVEQEDHDGYWLDAQRRYHVAYVHWPLAQQLPETARQRFTTRTR